MARVFAILFASTSLLMGTYIFRTNFVQSHSNETSGGKEIFFPVKLFVGTKSFVSARGTLSADWIAYKNNTFSILCTAEDGCIVASISQIGWNQIGTLDGPTVYPLKKWTEDAEVVAEDHTLCSRITITLDRMSQEVLWVETPINVSAIECKNADSQVRKASLKTSLFWQRDRQQR